MNTGWMTSLFPNRGKVFLSPITTRPPMGAHLASNPNVTVTDGTGSWSWPPISTQGST